ncbi:hypothetical protein Adt_06744 [Abeliophyllum distichum]|uniref:Uncharacterized protein n=1 Tax=Abeliophyllum distichum TaxID=126358 RepID=A0ABD1V952_9LAMI
MPLSTIPHPSSEVQASGQATVPSPPPSSSNLLTDFALPKDKGKIIAEDAGEAAVQKRKTHVAVEGFMRDACKARQTEEGHRSSPPFDGEPEDAENSAVSAGQKNRVRISQCHDELSILVMEMLSAHPAIMAVSVYKYWIQSWEKAAEEATVRERLELAEMNLIREFVLAKELFGIF